MLTCVSVLVAPTLQCGFVSSVTSLQRSVNVRGWWWNAHRLILLHDPVHAETKDQWARDDPAFVFIMTGFLLVCQCLGFRHSPAPRWSDGSSSGCCCCLRHCIQHFLGRRVGLAVASSGATVLPDRRGRSYIRLVRSLRVCVSARKRSSRAVLQVVFEQAFAGSSCPQC